MTSSRLQRLVRLKQLAEQVRVTELAERRQSMSEAQRRLSEVEARMDTMEESVDPSCASSLMAASHFREHLAVQASTQAEEVSRRAESVREGEAQVREAWTDRRQLETAHERAVAREAVEEGRREHLQMEEVALNLFARSDS